MIRILRKRGVYESPPDRYVPSSSPANQSLFESDLFTNACIDSLTEPNLEAAKRTK